MNETTSTHQDYVLGFAFKPDDLRWVLMLRKNRPEAQAGLMNGIGGKIEPQESPIDAMVREFKEETGLESIPENWREFSTLTGPWGTVYCYVTKDIPWTAEQFPIAPGETHTLLPDNEHPLSYYVSNLGLKSPGVVPNVVWLVPMARNFLVDDSFLGSTVHYS